MKRPLKRLNDSELEELCSIFRRELCNKCPLYSMELDAKKEYKEYLGCTLDFIKKNPTAYKDVELIRDHFDYTEVDLEEL